MFVCCFEIIIDIDLNKIINVVIIIGY